MHEADCGGFLRHVDNLHLFGFHVPSLEIAASYDELVYQPYAEGVAHIQQLRTSAKKQQRAYYGVQGRSEVSTPYFRVTDLSRPLSAVGWSLRIKSAVKISELWRDAG